MPDTQDVQTGSITHHDCRACGGTGQVVPLRCQHCRIRKDLAKGDRCPYGPLYLHTWGD
jgi:hypothetical protein